MSDLDQSNAIGGGNSEVITGETEEVGAETETEETETETTEVGDEGGESETDSSGFTDPSKIPPELLPIYKQMQADYTTKTQEIAALKKNQQFLDSTKGLIQKLYDPSNKEVLDKLMGNQEQQYPTDPVKYAEWIQQNTLKQMQEMMAQQEDYRKAESVDPRLSSDANFQQIILGLVSTNPDFVNRSITAEEATRRAVKFFDDQINTAKKVGKTELSEQAVKKSSKFSATTNGKPSSVGGNGAVSIHDAAKLAMEELGINS